MNIRFFVFGVVLLLASCSADKKESTMDEKKPQTWNVATEKVTGFAGEYNRKYSGRVEVKGETPISFKVGGTVAKLLVDEGDWVKKGQLLATLDATQAENSKALAVETFKQADDAYQRMKPMKENGTLPEIQWVDVATKWQQAKIAVEIATQNSGNYNLYAPKSGVITEKGIVPGVNILPGVTAMNIVDVQQLYINIPVPEAEVSKIKEGTRVQVSIAAADIHQTGIVDQIGVTGNLLSHTYPVKILLENSARKIKPGMVGEVELVLGKEVANDEVLVPTRALQVSADGKQYVYVEQNGKVNVKEVTTIEMINNRALVTGVTTGENVVVSGHNKLYNGASVAVQ